MPMCRASRSVIVTVALVTSCAHGGGGGGAHALHKNHDAPSLPSRAVVVVEMNQQADIVKVLRDRGVEQTNLNAEHKLLFDAEALAAQLGRPLPFPLPPAAAQAWSDGAAACLARGGRAPPIRNPVARDCAKQLGAAVWETHVGALDVDCVIEVQETAAYAYVPGSDVQRDHHYKQFQKVDPAPLVIDELFKAQPGPRKPVLTIPSAPSPTDPLLRGAFTELGNSLNVGCERPLPVNIVVADNETSFARALEAAWAKLPERPRTAPAVNCTANASGWVQSNGAQASGGWLDCAPALLPVGVMIDFDAATAGATARLAEQLVDHAISDTCKYEH